MLTLQQIYDYFSDEKKDTSDVSLSLFYRWMTTIANFLYAMKRGVDPEPFFSTQTFTVTSDPQTSNLPTGFFTLKEIGGGFFRIGGDGKDTDDELSKTGFGSKQRGYYLTGRSTVTFTGISDASQYKLRYLPKSPTFSDINQYFSLDKTSNGIALAEDESIEYLLNALNVLYSRWDEDVPSEISADQRFVRELEFILENERVDSSALSLPDFTSNF